MNWPTWIESELELVATLNSISAVHVRLKQSVAPGYDYQHPLQKQFNTMLEREAASGALSRSDGVWKTMKQVSMSPGEVAACIFQNGRALQIFNTMTFCSRIALVKYLDSAILAIQGGDLLVPFGCLRGILEHVAHYHGIIQKLNPLQIPDNFEAANRTLVDTLGSIVKAAYATRINWEALYSENLDAKLDQEHLKYVQRDDRADREARSILSSIDSLNKAVKGTRMVYEVLCEFVHPNVGNLMAFTETAELSPDSDEMVLVRKRISPNVPKEFVTQSAKPLRRIFRQADLCLQHFENLHSDEASIRERILKITQIVIRQLVSRNRKAIDRYTTCPCGSGKRLKNCCGAS